jgi:hypothetical protein
MFTYGTGNGRNAVEIFSVIFGGSEFDIVILNTAI